MIYYVYALPPTDFWQAFLSLESYLDQERQSPYGGDYDGRAVG